jgi:hypothetical protein
VKYIFLCGELQNEVRMAFRIRLAMCGMVQRCALGLHFVNSHPTGYEGGELDVIHAARAKVDFGGFFAVLISARH